MKRIKKVFSNSSEVLHRWANQTQTDARSANVFFNGLSCYSYGYHYELGRIVEYKGVKMAVINGRGYSNTTAKHIRYAESAVDGLMPYVKTQGDFTNEAIFNALLASQDAIFNKIFSNLNGLKFTNYSKNWFIESLTSMINDHNKLVILLNESQLIIKLEECQDLINLVNEHIDSRIKRQAALDAFNTSPEGIAAKAKKEAAKLAAIQKKKEETILEWRQGVKNVLPYDLTRTLPFKLLRLNKDKTMIETSGGASVKLEHALVLYKRIQDKSAKQGQHVGPYKLDNYDDKTIKIGCHIIELNEVKQVLQGMV